MSRNVLTFMLLLGASPLFAAEPANHRQPANDADLRSWLENMIWHHRFTDDEIIGATGLAQDTLAAARRRFNISLDSKPQRPHAAPLLVLPYPGGRHPRIGFLDGAIRPQRETKISVFTPWDERSYVVVDAPEALWSNLGLTYLAHTHIPTVWTKQNLELPPLEWQCLADGSLQMERSLPNGIVFGTRVVPERQVLRLEMWLTNGTKEKLTDLRVQMCAMLKGALGFTQQTNANKVFAAPYAAVESDAGKRWVIMAWEPCHRTWGNEKCPCLHSDPKFPDCAPAQTQRIRGILTFYQGDDVKSEFRRLDRTGWREARAILRGKIVDADTGQPLAARMYIQGSDRAWHHAKSAVRDGNAVPYDKQRPDTKSVETHTSLSAHPFVADLPPGTYTVTIEHGPAYRPLTQELTLTPAGAEFEFKLQRWIDPGRRGWYSGDTHVHRTLEELPTVMLAEDLNVALPLVHWVHDAFTPPGKNPVRRENDPGRLIRVDDTHVIYPRNTEYEIFTVGKQRHVLGAFFVLNHKTPFALGVPPLGPIARQARLEGALIELDKHNWPWSMALVPVLPVDLFELTNNHVWRTEFGFRAFGEREAEYMKIERNADGWTEWGWLDFGFKNYYALLNCGFRLRPTAGTASGVHPVPLGFGRVFVHLPERFSYEGWIQGLKEGRSFVTTGPMLWTQLNGQLPGSTLAGDHVQEFRLTGSAMSAVPLQRIEIIVNGEIATTLLPTNRKIPTGGFESILNEVLRISGTSWIAVRCFEDRADKRVRFAHTGPFHIEIKEQPLRPRKVETDYLIQRVEEQIRRSTGVLPKEAIDEYRTALRIYQGLAEKAR